MERAVNQRAGANYVKRVQYEQVMLQMATTMSLRATCAKVKQAAIITDMDGHIAGVGYNGSPAGLHHCSSVGGTSRIWCKRHNQCACLHAELNAILNLARHGSLPDYLKCYCTSSPCCQCMKALVQIGVRQIFYLDKYPDDYAFSLAKAAEITMTQVKLKPLPRRVRYA